MPKKYVPSQRHLKKAWKLKQNKHTVKQICSELKIGFGQYEHNRHVFNSYYAQQKLADKNDCSNHRPGKGIKSRAQSKFSGPNYKDGEQKLTPQDIDTDVLKSYVICGFSRDRIAELLGISRRKLLMIQKESKSISDILTKSVEETASDVLRNGLLTLCKTHSVKDNHFASYQGMTYKTPFDRVHRPNLGAIKYLMSNTIGWQSENKPKTENNKGAILRMMDEIANSEDGVNSVEEEEINETDN